MGCKLAKETKAIEGREVMNERLWNVQEVAEFLGLAIESVYHLVSRRQIPCVRLSARCLRFDPNVIAVWVQEKSTKGEAK